MLSATTGQPPAERRAYTAPHARLAAALPRGRHIELPDTSHAVNQEPPDEIAAAIGTVLDQAGRPA